MIKKTALYGALILCTLLLVTCTTDEESMIGPFGDASKYISATKFSVENDELYVDGDSTLVTIVLLDNNGSPIEGLKVTFSVDIGKITDYDISDSTGTAEAMYKSGEEAGEALITAHTGPKAFEIPITVKKYEPTTIELSAESLILLADGNDYTKITATPRDKDGKLMPDVLIKFETSLGTLSSSSTAKGNDTSLDINSGDAGEDAVVYLWSEATIGTAEVAAIAGDTSSIDVSFYLDLPAYLLLTADPKVLLADGESMSTITATVLDEYGNPMEGITVKFLTSTGSLDFPVRTTDANGLATVVLTSTTEETTATVTTLAYITETIDVQFTQEIPYQIEISASEARVIADGTSTSTITAIPKDQNGDIMPGIGVSFYTDLGFLNASYVETDENGIAVVNVYSNEEGTAIVTASVSSVESTTKVIFYEYNPTYIVLNRAEDSILADGFSQVSIIASVYDSDDQVIPGAVIDFSTNHGQLSKTTGVVADQNGNATVTLTSEGSTVDLTAEVTAELQGVSLSGSIDVKFRGITMTTVVDSSQFGVGGYYNVYVKTTLIETSTGGVVEEAAVQFTSTIGEMIPEISSVNENGVALSTLFAEVTGSLQSNLVITSQLPNATNVSKQTNSTSIPGVEALITTIDDEIMGDGQSWALVKATLRETTGKAIENMFISWETTVGTIIGQSLTNSTGHTIDTLRIENSVNSNTNTTIRTNFGAHIWDSEIVTIIPPVNDNRLILGFEPDTTGHGIVPCDIDTSIATRDAGITAHFVDENGNGIDGQAITFSVVPNNLAAICETDTSDANFNGKATVMMAYPPQNIGQIVRVWAAAPDGTRGNIDVVLPKHEEEEEEDG